MPRGSIYTTIMELGPQNHNGDGLLGPSSIIVVYVDPLGCSPIAGTCIVSSTLKQRCPKRQHLLRMPRKVSPWALEYHALMLLS